MNNVICVYTGTKYNINHVNVLYNMVERNLSQSFNFYCLTDNRGQEFNNNIKLIDVPQPLMDNYGRRRIKQVHRLTY